MRDSDSQLRRQRRAALLDAGIRTPDVWLARLAHTWVHRPLAPLLTAPLPAAWNHNALEMTIQGYRARFRAHNAAWQLAS